MRFYLFVFIFILPTFIYAQIYEAGVILSGTNATSMVDKKLLNPSNVGFGLLFKWNKSQRYAWRASLSYTNLSFEDKEALDLARISRKLNGNTALLEFSSGLEVNFLPFNLRRLGSVFTPYLYSGITVFGYDHNFFNEFNELINKKDISFAVPIHFGAKIRVGSNTILAAEVGFRFTFTDNLDGSNANQYIFGDVYNNDWYVFSGITVTHVFSNKSRGERVKGLRIW